MTTNRHDRPYHHLNTSKRRQRQQELSACPLFTFLPRRRVLSMPWLHTFPPSSFPLPRYSTRREGRHFSPPLVEKMSFLIYVPSMYRFPPLTGSATVPSPSVLLGSRLTDGGRLNCTRTRILPSTVVCTTAVTVKRTVTYPLVLGSIPVCKL